MIISCKLEPKLNRYLNITIVVLFAKTLIVILISLRINKTMIISFHSISNFSDPRGRGCAPPLGPIIFIFMFLGKTSINRSDFQFENTRYLIRSTLVSNYVCENLRKAQNFRNMSRQTQKNALTSKNSLGFS